MQIIKFMDDSELENSDDILSPNTDLGERSSWIHKGASKAKRKRFRVLKDVRIDLNVFFCLIK